MPNEIARMDAGELVWGRVDESWNMSFPDPHGQPEAGDGRPGSGWMALIDVTVTTLARAAGRPMAFFHGRRVIRRWVVLGWAKDVPPGAPLLGVVVRLQGPAWTPKPLSDEEAAEYERLAAEYVAAEKGATEQPTDGSATTVVNISGGRQRHRASEEG